MLRRLWLFFALAAVLLVLAVLVTGTAPPPDAPPKCDLSRYIPGLVVPLDQNRKV